MRSDPSLRFDVPPGVYAPAEDTFLLLDAIDPRPGERVLEVGTGCGLVAVHAAGIARVVATDVHPAAVRAARDNAARNGREVAVARADLARGIRGPFDLVAFNPPYLPASDDGADATAWTGGAEGSEVAVRFLQELRSVLARDGRAYLVLSSRNRAGESTARRTFDAEPVARRPGFHEELRVWRLRERRQD